MSDENRLDEFVDNLPIDDPSADYSLANTDPFRTIDAALATAPQMSMDVHIAERTLPHSRDAEVALLGAILRNNTVLGESALLGIGSKEFFFCDSHRRIFAVMRAMYERSNQIDFATLCAELERTGELDEVGGRNYLCALLQYPRADAEAAHIRIIREKARIRNLIFALNRSLSECYEAELPAPKLLGNVLRWAWEMAEEVLGDQSG